MAEDDERVGVYIARALFDDARAAFLADYADRLDSPDTFTAWVTAAIEAHAARAAADRAALALPAIAGKGATRGFDLPPATVRRTHEAIAADREHQRWLSVSQFICEALGAAVGDVLERTGRATLPPPPARLPRLPSRPPPGGEAASP